MYCEDYYYEKPTSVNGETAGAAIGAGLSIGMLAASALIFLVCRYDILSSGVLSLLFYLLTYKKEWPTPVYIAVALVIFVVSMIIQHVSKIGRLVYGLFMCVVISILGPIFIGYDTSAEMYKIMGICFAVSAIWGFVSYKVYVKK